MSPPAKTKGKKGKPEAPAELALPPIPPPPEGGWPVEEVTLTLLRLDSRLQSRAWENADVRFQYHDALVDGIELPPVEVVRDERGINWVWDGFHRLKAAESADRETFKARIRPGDFRLALRLSLSANAAHGLRRSNADKERTVERVLEDPEWSKLSTRALGEMCGVSHEYVARLRRAKEQAAERARKVEEDVIDPPTPATPPPLIRPLLPEATREAMAEHNVEIMGWEESDLARYAPERQQQIVERIAADNKLSVFAAHEAIKRDERLASYRETEMIEFTPGGSRWGVVEVLDDIEVDVYFAWIDARQDLQPIVGPALGGRRQSIEDALAFATSVHNTVISVQVADLAALLSVDEDAALLHATNSKSDGHKGLSLLIRLGSARQPLEHFSAPLATLLDLSAEGDLVVLCGHGDVIFAFDLLKEGRHVLMWHPEEEIRQTLRDKLAAKSKTGGAA